MSRKIIGVTVGTTLPKPNFKQTDPTKGDYIRNKPDFEGLKEQVNDISSLVGDKKVSVQITEAIENKSDVGHNHDADYDAKGAADTALASAKTYADGIKNDLLNGAGAAYDTLKELGDLIDDNQDAIDALETVAAGKADAEHIHDIADVTDLQTQLNAKVPTSRTVNGKALSANITLSASDVGADESGAANTALTNANAYTDAEISEWIGDETVSTQIAAAIDEITPASIGASDTGHTHNYAGSSSAGGAANSANKLNTNAGSETNPVYFVNGVPVKTTYTLEASVPSGAKFTDTVYTHPSYTAKSSGLYKVAVDSTGHVSGTTAVAKSDITALGIPAQDTTYSAATQSAAGLMSATDKKTLDTLDDLVGDVAVSEQITDAINETITGLSVSGKIITYTKGDGSTGTITTQDTNTTYSAAGSSLGLVKSGGDVTISDGVITVKDDSHNHTIANVDNLQTTLDGKANKSQCILYIEGDSSSTTDATNKVATWIGSHSDITTYFSGLTILYKVPTAGSTTTTLNINGLGATTVVRNATTGISTACPVDGVLLLTYTVDSDGTAYWKTADYDSNTKTTTGTSNKASTKLYLAGATSQSSSGATTYSNKNVYIGTDNCLYSNGAKVATAAEVTAVSDLVGDTAVSTQISNAIASKSDTGHNHSASNITSGTLPITRGGTGATSLTAGSYLVGNGTSAVSVKTPAEVLEDIGAVNIVSVTAKMPSSDYWTYLTYCNGMFMAVIYATATQAVAYSADGISWTFLSMPSSATWSNVAYGNGVFVSVNSKDKAAYSTNGINWTSTSMPSSGSAAWSEVAYGNGVFVAIASPRSSKAAYSTDGITWTASTLPSSTTWRSATYGNGKFVTVADGTKAAYSTDGITWTASTLPSSADWFSVTYGNGKFVTVADGTKAAYSTDGITWTASTLPSSADWYAVACGNDVFIAVARRTDTVAYSTDGINWTSTPYIFEQGGENVTSLVRQALGLT